jgi:hypothetical protein
MFQLSYFFPEMNEPERQAAIEAAAEKLKLAGVDVADFELPDDFERSVR